MFEDEIYRASTQFRLWSFTKESLVSMRSATNSSAIDAVKSAIQKGRYQNSVQAPSNGEDHGPASSQEIHVSSDVDCLTVEEEQKLVRFYCIRAMEFSDFCEYPTNVKATAVQYLKRFYLSNSPMTYHPKEMMPCALFFATKTENHYTSLRSFVSKLKKTKEEDVVAPEFFLTQGLRFTFDVRHPQRGLEGGFMELVSLASGKGQVSKVSTKTSDEIQNEMFGIESPKGGHVKSGSTKEMVLRIQNAHGKAKETLKTSALLTDAYFLYTPSQIWLSSLLLADEPLALFYINAKLAPSELRTRLLAALHDCADLLRSSPSAKPGDAEMKDLTRIDKKLYKCRNPEKMDLVAINNAQKRDGGGKLENGVDDKIIKKRKLERQNSAKEADDIFGPAIKKE